MHCNTVLRIFFCLVTVVRRLWTFAQFIRGLRFFFGRRGLALLFSTGITSPYSFASYVLIVFLPENVSGFVYY